MNTANMTLASTVLAAALGLGLGLMSTPAEAHCAGKHTEGHPHCAGGPITYTAQLTAGAFVFGPVVVTPNTREDVLRSGVDLNFDISTSPAVGTWDKVFNTCIELLAQDSVDDFFVGEDDWQIDKSGGVRVRLHDIRFDQGDPALLNSDVPAEVTVELVGNEYIFDESFLPEATETRTYVLDGYLIRGETLKGIHPRSGCQERGSGTPDIILLIDSSVLVITATATPP